MLGGNTLDANIYETIIFSKIKKKGNNLLEIWVTFEGGGTERIWTFDSRRFSFDVGEFIGMSKIEAIFYCDRKKPIIF